MIPKILAMRLRLPFMSTRFRAWSMGLVTGTALVYLINDTFINSKQREILLEARRALLRNSTGLASDPRVLKTSSEGMSIAETLNLSLISLSDRYIFQNRRAPQ